MKLAAANADCKWCLDEIEAARDCAEFPRQGVVPMDSGEQRSATPGTNTGLATQTDLSDQFRTRIAMTAAVQLVDAVSFADNDASASLACLRRVQNETSDARIRKCKVGRSSRPSARSR